MDIEGKIILDLGLQSGMSKAGREWKKKEFVLETFGSYPRKVKFTLFGERVDQIPIEVGNSYVLSVDIESREFNDRWYTDVNCYGARPYTGGAPQGYPQGGMQPQQPMAYPQQPAGYPQAAPQTPFGGDSFPPAPTPGNFDGGDSSDDLPF